jgi:hypothetical protein
MKVLAMAGIVLIVLGVAALVNGGITYSQVFDNIPFLERD